jgi:hypothetical protein
MLLTGSATVSGVVPPIDRGVPESLQTAMFALGRFWGPDAQFAIVKGIYRTRVGYTGGVKRCPTYCSLGDHTEALQDFDPGELSHEEVVGLLQSFVKAATCALFRVDVVRFLHVSRFQEVRQ